VIQRARLFALPPPTRPKLSFNYLLKSHSFEDFFASGKTLWIGFSKGITEGERMKYKYRVHRFNISMTKDQSKLEQFLNGLEGEVVTIIPNVTPVPATYVDFLLIVEKVS